MHPQNLWMILTPFSMFITGNVTLKAYIEIFGSSIFLSKFTSINFDIPYAGILSKPVMLCYLCIIHLKSTHKNSL